MTRKKKQGGSIWLDSLFATIFIYLFMYMVSNISAFQIFDAFDSVGQALEDMEMTDIAFSKMREQPTLDEDIVLVNIGNLPREGIAEQIRILDKYEPRVIGVDSFFKTYVNDTLGTLSLVNAISEAKTPIVMAAKVEQSDSLAEIHLGSEIYDKIYLSDSMFLSGVDLALVNLDTEAEFQEDVKICRQFPSFRKLTNGDMYVAFGAKLAGYKDPQAVEELIKRDNEFEVINFRGDFYNFFETDTTVLKKFAALDYYEVLGESFDSSIVKDKIIILGYIGDDFEDRFRWEDKLFTPLNKDIAGRANPDMYGPVIHANIASMVLNRDYVGSFGETTENVLSFMLCYLNVVLFTLVYKRMGAWYDGITKVFQVLEVILLLFLIIELFAFYSFKLELTVGLFAIALAGDLLEIYYGVIRNMVLKIGYRLTSKRKKVIEEET